jgi:hypothetical protein
MRTLIVLTLLGSLAAAAPYGRRDRCGPVNRGFRYHANYVGRTHGFRYHAKYVPYRWSCTPHRGYYRGYYRSPYRSHYRYGAGYRYRRYYYPRYHGDCYAYGYGYRYGRRYYRPYLSFSPIYTRILTVLTIDDEEFDGPAAAQTPQPDADGLPRPRKEPVGARFLVDLD